MAERVELSIQQSDACKSDASGALFSECLALTGSKIFNKPMPAEPKELVFKLAGDQLPENSDSKGNPSVLGKKVDAPKEKVPPAVPRSPEIDVPGLGPGMSQSELDKFMEKIKAQEPQRSFEQDVWQWAQQRQEEQFDQMHIPQRDRGGRIIPL